MNLINTKAVLYSKKFYTLTAFGHLKSCGGGHNVSHICTLRKTSRTRTGVHKSYNTRENVKQLAAIDDNVFKISTFGPITEQGNLTVSQLGTVRKFKRG
jgi:3D (Asp-Asp-Asp) domain-containing protein